MISYDKLFKLLNERKITTYFLLQECGIGSATMKRLKEGKSVSTNTIDKFCKILDCKWEDVAEYIPPQEPEPEPLTPIEEVPKEFKARILWLLQRDKKRQADLVRDIGFSRAVISAYCIGKVKPQKENQKKIAEYFNVDEDWLMGRK